MIRIAGLGFFIFIFEPAWGQDNWYLNTTATSGVTPAGKYLQTAVPPSNGSSNQVTITGAPQYWYTSPLNCSYSAGSYQTVLWVASGPSSVTVQLAATDSTGGSAVVLGTDTQSTNCGGNCPVTFTFSGVPAQNLSNQLFRIGVTLARGASVNVVYFDSFFNSRLVTSSTCGAATNTPTPTSTPLPNCSPLSSIFHLVSTPVAATPAGLLMQTSTTGNSGFSPTTVIGSTPLYWYSPVITGTYLKSTYTLNLWTNQPGSASPVTLTLGYSNPNGSGYTLLGSVVEDVNASGAGNHVTGFPIPNVGPVTITNQVLVINLTGAGGATMVFNGGTDFDTKLTTPAGFTPGCTCPYSEQAETNSTSDSVTNINNPGATPPPPGWQNPGFIPVGWGNAVIWTNPTGPSIFGTPWTSWDSNGDGLTVGEEELILHPFMVPANAVSITATLNIAVDDNSSSYINGVTIQSDPITTVTNQVMRSFAVPAGAVVPGNNILAISNGNSVVVHMGYDFQLAIVYTTNCLASPTPTPTHTPTPTSTNTPTNSPTNTPILTPTNTPTPTYTLTPTPTPISTNTPTYTNTPMVTPTPTATPAGLHVWPNPFDPQYAVGGKLKVYQVSAGSTLNLYTISGESVVNSLTPDNTGLITWDGRNKNGVMVSTGTYFYVIQNNNSTLLTGKLLVLNGH